MASGKEAKRRKEREKKRKLREKLHPKGVPRLRGPSGPLVAVPDFVVQDVLAKRDLLAHPDLARAVIARYLAKSKTLVAKIDNPQVLRSAEYDKLRKWARQELRVLVGLFIVETDPAKLLDASTDMILGSHRSTLERQPYYADGLYAALFDGKLPTGILDLAAGLNPCSYQYLGCAPHYVAVDVSPQLMDFVQAWFTKEGIAGTAFAADVTTMTSYPPADTVFLFKATDVLERVRYGIGEHMLDQLVVQEGRRVIVSFATATIGGGREISLTKRSWVERWAEKRERSVRVHDIPGERFYILE